MLFSWWKRRRRRRILAEPFPAAWQAILDADVGHYHLLAGSDQARVREAVQILMAEKSWEGCRGLELTDQIRVTIAALAAVLILRMGDFFFDNVQTILVYPAEFVAPEEKPLAGDVALHDESDRLGEAHQRGPVILSWTEVQTAAREPGHGENLVFHEFAHQLDMLNGAFDGTPLLADEPLRHRWTTVMDHEYRRLIRAAERGRATLLDSYGATDPAEFFAVATECFFDAPLEMRRVHPELYDLFASYFRQDPAEWPGWRS
jgi:Mlc titration factor MtfA (ptsG expression regulator)